LNAAREAAKLVHAGWRKRPAFEHKLGVELVTSFDRASEDLLRELLAPTSFACVGEEDGGEHGNGAPPWFVDPLDGTTHFVHGHPFFCVSVGLVLGARPLLGAVVAPALGGEWTGVAGKWATRDGAACEVSAVTTFDDALLATGFPYDRRSSPDNNFDAFVA